MASSRYVFTIVPGHPPSGRRVIGFLEETGNLSLNAKQEFDSLKPNKDRDVHKRFDHWLGGARHDKWFHSWPNDSEVKECFCFRWDEKNGHHRFYGYICNPQPRTNPPFQVCVLTFHDVKNDESTNRNLLLRSMKLRSDIMVRMAINFVFPDEESTAKERLQ
jgi:hypothetical protein